MQGKLQKFAKMCDICPFASPDPRMWFPPPHRAAAGKPPVCSAHFQAFGQTGAKKGRMTVLPCGPYRSCRPRRAHAAAESAPPPAPAAPQRAGRDVPHQGARRKKPSPGSPDSHTPAGSLSCRRAERQRAFPGKNEPGRCGPTPPSARE